MTKTILVIDCGNSQVKFSLVKDGVLQKIFSIRNRDLSDCDDILVHALSVQDIAAEEIHGILLASVVPTISTQIDSAARRADIGIFHVDHQHCGGLAVRVPCPQEVGADRLANALAARTLFGNAQMIIDFGTATTIDILDMRGAYCGGLILPGLELSLQTLHQATAKLPLVRITRPEKVLGTTTVEAINQGLYWGYVAMLEGLVDRLRHEQQCAFHVIATGGYAELLAPDCLFFDHLDPELTLKGLNFIAQTEWK